MPTMRHRFCLAASGAVLLLLGAHHAVAQTAPAQTAPDLHIIAFGEYIVGRKTGMLDPAVTPGTSVPVDLVEDVHFVNHASHIEARLCRGFGIQFEASNLGPTQTAPITIRVTHPPMANAGKQNSTVDAWQSTISGKAPSLAGYTFDHPWEIVPGAWTFAVMSGNTVLVTQQFDVVTTSDPAGASAISCRQLVS
jgi:Domain of unknown function (DUF3859)